jgi:two-component system sensor histidine kinase BarA
MDTNLPGVDGLTATERIRKLDELRSAKIIFISGRAEPHLRERAFAAGGDEYFVKPIDVNSLQQALLKYV